MCVYVTFVINPPCWRPAGLCSTAATFFLLIFIFFNWSKGWLSLTSLFSTNTAISETKLEQRDLRTYRTDLHQPFRIGRHAAENVRHGIGFAVGLRTLPWQPILGEIGDMLSFLGLAFHNGWQDGKADGRINTIDVLSASLKHLVNFGSLTPEFTTVIW